MLVIATGFKELQSHAATHGKTGSFTTTPGLFLKHSKVFTELGMSGERGIANLGTHIHFDIAIIGSQSDDQSRPSGGVP